MAIITNYATLKTAVADYLGRDDLTAFVPNFIESIENKLYRTLEIRGLETAFSETTSSGVIDISSLSTPYRNFKYLYVDSSPITFLEFTTPEVVYREYSNRSETADKPRLVAREADNLIFGPAAADSITVKGIYYALLANLNDSDPTTNWFTDNMPELLLYGALTHAEPFIVGDRRIQIWASLYNDLFSSLTEFERREKRGGGTTSIKVV